MKDIIGAIAAALAIVGLVPYIIDVLKKKTKPHLFTWIVWSIATTVVFIGQWISGGGAGSWTTGVTGILTIIITILAFKFGTKNVTFSDKIFFSSSLSAIVLWAVTREPTISVILVTATDMFAFFPTIRKSALEPEAETLFTYSLNILRHGLSIIALQRYNIVTVLFPAVLVIMNAILSAVIFIRRRKS